MKNLFITFFVFSCLSVSGQYLDDLSDNMFHTITVEDGLSQNTVNCILKDKTGFLWFGTNSGLNRYDSNTIIVFHADLGGGVQLENLQIYDLKEDRLGIIWIGTSNGIVKYDPEFDDVEQVPFLKGENGAISVFCIEEDDDSSLWLGTSSGLVLFDKTEGVIKTFKHEPYQPYSIASSEVYSLCNDEDILWVGTSAGLNVLDKKQQTFNQYLQVSDFVNVGQKSVIRSIEKDEQGNVFIGTEYGGLLKFDAQTKHFVCYNTSNSKIPHNDIRDIHISTNGYLWLASNNGGVCKFDPQNGNVKIFRHEADNINGLSNNSAYSIYEDREGILWVGTYSGGCNYNTSNRNKFKITKHIPFESNSICESSIRSLYLDEKENLWIGTLGGLSFYNSATRSFKSFVHDPANPKSLSFNVITAVFEDSKGAVWIGTYSGGINLYFPGKNGFKHFRHDANNLKSISGDNIYCITEDAKENVWIATSNGLCLYNRASDDFERIGKLDVRDIKILSDGRLILAITGGVAIYDPETGNFNFSVESKLMSIPVVSLYLKDDNNAWLCTQGKGLVHYKIKEKELTFLNKEEGLPSDFVSSIIPYKDDSFWISTYKGICFYDGNHLFRNFDLADGVPFYEFHPRSSIVLPDGNFAFGGSEGLVYFDPESLLKSNRISNLVLSSFKIDNVEIKAGDKKSPLEKGINYVDEIKLDYGQNDFSIEYVDLNFLNPGYSQYEYLLDNYDDDWNDLGNKNTVSFTNLDPGDYTFKIKTKNNDMGTDQSSMASIDIRIRPPFWMTWYFYILLAIVALGLSILYKKYTLISIDLRNKLSLEKLEYEKQREFSQLRIRFFTYISHELRTPLTLILDPIKRLKELNKNPEISKYVNLVDKSSKRLLLLVNQILDFRMLENDALKLQVSELNVNEVVNDVFSNFIELSLKKHINYHFDFNGDPVIGWVDKDKIEKIMYNLLTNAFKFTRENGDISVKLVQKNPDKITLSIKDNGVGIAQEKLDKIFDLFYKESKTNENISGGFGLGLSYVRRLVSLHHGTIHVDSTIGEGTDVVIELPVNKESYLEGETMLVANRIEENGRGLIDQTPLGLNEVKSRSIPVHGKGVPKVMVVEDEPDLQEYLYASIVQNYQCFVASNGKEGLEIIKRELPDIIISDNVMPEMDGIELCKVVKSTPDLQHIPFIILSAWNSDDFKMNGLKKGAADYMSKPFDIGLLLAKIDSILTDLQRVKEISKSMFKVDPDSPDIETEDAKFIKRAQAIIEENIDNPEFNSKVFEKKLFVSHALLYRKLKRLTGKSSNEFIREFRLKRAAQIFEKDSSLTVAEVGQKVGHIDPKYFSQCFKKLYGVTPTEYRNNIKK